MKPPVEACWPTTVLCIILSVRCHLAEWVSTTETRNTVHVHVLGGLMTVFKMCWHVQETVGWAATTASSALTS